MPDRGARRGEVEWDKFHTCVIQTWNTPLKYEKDKDRTRGWLKGIIVQIDNKMIAVQFRSNVFLTDGWMVPDRILWYPVNSQHIRPMPGKKSKKKEKELPDY